LFGKHSSISLVWPRKLHDITDITNNNIQKTAKNVLTLLMKTGWLTS